MKKLITPTWLKLSGYMTRIFWFYLLIGKKLEIVEITGNKKVASKF